MADTFDPDKYLAETFDPDEYLADTKNEQPALPTQEPLTRQQPTIGEPQKVAATKGPAITQAPKEKGVWDTISEGAQDLARKADTAVASLAQSITFGTSDEIEGAILGAIDFFTDADLKGAEGLGEAYKKRRDAAREWIKWAQQANPNLAAVTEAAGSFLIPGGQVVKGAGLLGRGLRTAGKSALEGGAYAYGTSEEEGLVEQLADTAAGAGLGGILGGGTAALGKVGSLATKKGRAELGEQALRTVVGTTSLVKGGKRLRELAGEKGDSLRKKLAEGDVNLVDSSTGKVRKAIKGQVKELKNKVQRGELEKASEMAQDLNKISENLKGAYLETQEKALESLKGKPVNVNLDRLRNELNVIADVLDDRPRMRLKDAINRRLDYLPSDQADVANQIINLRREVDDIVRIGKEGPRNRNQAIGMDIRRRLNQVRDSFGLDDASLSKADALYTQKKRIDRTLGKFSRQADVPSEIGTRPGTVAEASKLQKELKSQTPMVGEQLESLSKRQAELGQEGAEQLKGVGEAAMAPRDLIRSQSVTETLEALKARGGETAQLASDLEALAELRGMDPNALAPLLGGLLGATAGAPFGLVSGGFGGGVIGAGQGSKMARSLDLAELLKSLGKSEQAVSKAPASNLNELLKALGGGRRPAATMGTQSVLEEE